MLIFKIDNYHYSKDFTEAESGVKKVKLATAHAGDKLESLNTIVANINADQRTHGSGSAAELFLQRTLGSLVWPTSPLISIIQTARKLLGPCPEISRLT